MSDTQHTPVPWSIGKRRWITSGDLDIARIHSVSKIGEGEAVANAEFMIRACNSHDALLEALERLVEWESVIGGDIIQLWYGNGDEDDTEGLAGTEETDQAWQQARNAIAKAKEGGA